MSLRSITPCDCDGGCCPYDAQYISDCEYWCGSEEPEDFPPEEFEDCGDLEDLFDYLVSDPEDYYFRHLDPDKEWSD